jgi:AraC family transcriptional regulator
MSEFSSFSHWYSEGRLAPYVHEMKHPGTILDLVEAVQPAGNISHPAVPDLVLIQTTTPVARIWGDIGWGRFDQRVEKGQFFLAAPQFDTTVISETENGFRGLSFPLAQWQPIFDEATEGRLRFEDLSIDRGLFGSAALGSTMRKLWTLCADEGAPSRLLARSAGCEILAELCRLNGAFLAPAKGGLAPCVQKRCIEFIRANYAEDVSLEDIADQAQLSQFHFARMFKQSVGVPPRVYLTRIRMEKACELLEKTNMAVTEIAFEVGYSSSQAFARVFLKELSLTPTAYRSAASSGGRSFSGGCLLN